MNGYNFTDRVRKVLQMAREEAARLRHEYVGTEHILLGLIREGEGVAVAALTNLNVDLEDVTAAIHETGKPGKNQAKDQDLPYTSRAKKILELSMSEARELNDAGVTVEMAREEIIRILGREPPQSAAGPHPVTGRRSLHPESADQLFTFAIAFIELYRLRDGTYPDSLEALPFLVVMPEGEKPALRYSPDFWKGLGIRRTNVDRSM